MAMAMAMAVAMAIGDALAVVWMERRGQIIRLTADGVGTCWVARPVAPEHLWGWSRTSDLRRALQQHGPAQWSLLVAADLINADRISWDNYNEANDLSVRAEQCQEEHGCYSARICADAIYMTVGNKKFCKDHGIRLSGRARKKETAGIDGQTVEQ
jgi:hypothetical protein